MANWKKITSLDDFKNMGKNTPLIKYPVDGDPKDEIDLNDKRNISNYVIDEVKMFNELDLIDPDLGKDYTSSLGRVTGGILNKRFQDMIKEGIWWYRPKETDK